MIWIALAYIGYHGYNMGYNIAYNQRLNIGYNIAYNMRYNIGLNIAYNIAHNIAYNINAHKKSPWAKNRSGGFAMWIAGE